MAAFLIQHEYGILSWFSEPAEVPANGCAEENDQHGDHGLA
jgi:hypothetical protein